MHTSELRSQAITKQFKQGATNLHVLRGVSAHFERGKTYAITGASGAGKSTLLHIISGLDNPTTGSITLNGQDITHMTALEKAYFLNKTVGLVFQLPYLIDELSVVENVMIKGVIGGATVHACKEKAYHLLKQVGLADKAECKPSTLSGGQQQRVAIVRALFNEPDFLLADEPTGNLDEQTGKEIVAFMLTCQAQWHMGIIVSSHDEYVTNAMGTVLRLHNGLLV